MSVAFTQGIGAIIWEYLIFVASSSYGTRPGTFWKLTHIIMKYFKDRTFDHLFFQTSERYAERIRLFFASSISNFLLQMANLFFFIICDSFTFFHFGTFFNTLINIVDFFNCFKIAPRKIDFFFDTRTNKRN